jgi:nitrite reductase (NO-forming)
MMQVAPGGAGIVEFTCEVPGRYVLVDHALSRAERGLAGYLIVEGENDPEIFAALDEDGNVTEHDPHGGH